MIDELLDVARIVSGKLRLERTAVDLNEIVRAAVEVVQGAAEAKRVAIVFETDVSSHTIYGDGARLQQIVWNLLSNAVKFTEEGGRIVVQIRHLQAAAEIIVTDDGAGIPAEFLPCVFEPFRQADDLAPDVTEGWGWVCPSSDIWRRRMAAPSPRLATARAAGRALPFGCLPGWSHRTGRCGPRGLPRSRRPLTHSPVAPVLVLDDDGESREVAAAHLTSRKGRGLDCPVDPPTRFKSCKAGAHRRLSWRISRCRGRTATTSSRGFGR